MNIKLILRYHYDWLNALSIKIEAKNTVEPPSMLLKVAGAWWLLALFLHSLIECPHGPWVQQYLRCWGLFFVLSFFLLDAPVFFAELESPLDWTLLAVCRSLVTPFGSWCKILSYIPFATCHLSCFDTAIAFFLRYHSDFFFSFTDSSASQWCNWFSSFNIDLSHYWSLFTCEWGLVILFVADCWPFCNIVYWKAFCEEG